MRNHVRLALLCLATSAVPAFAQTTLPQCGATNFDQSRNVFTIMNAADNAVNQQCYLTVYPSGTLPSEAQQSPSSYLLEGSYAIELSGGGGGGGAGALKDQGGGGGGAGAAPSRSVRYLSPGVYKLTIGTGGDGGISGVHSESGNPTSLINAHTGQLIAGFEGADTWRQRTQGATDGRGGEAAVGGSSGGSGGDSGAQSEEAAQPGEMLQTAGYYASAGSSGSESGRTARTDEGRVAQSNAGGGGGAGVGSGGSGGSNSNTPAGMGSLGGGGGGGSGGINNAETGARGGDGFIRLSMTEPAPQVIAPAPQAIAPEPAAIPLAPAIHRYTLSADALFGFGKSMLNPAGEAKLDELVHKLQSVNIDSISSTGHADRIGSEQVNQQISHARAESVQAYLASKGVQSNRNSAVGKGETQPVTALGDCKGAVSAKIIACLQPDRRVDIDVVVSNKTVSMN